MRIAHRDIGDSHPAYIIAEIGVNHDGDPARALALVNAAAEAKADAIKLQLFRTDLLLSKAARLAEYQRDAGEADPFEMLTRLELPDEAMRACVRRAHELDLHAIVSVFSRELVGPASEIGFDAFKSASPDVVNKPLLSAMVEAGKPLIVSTGTATLAEVTRANEWLAGQKNIAFLHCVSAYPTPPEQASLLGIAQLREALAHRAVGYSDHTLELETGSIAVALGARLLEKHISHSIDAVGPDHASSLTPAQFAAYVRLVRHAEAMFGDRGKSPRAIEGDVRSLSRQSLIAARDIAPGETLTPSDVTIKRPGAGLEPWRLDEVMGHTVIRPIASDTPILADDLEGMAEGPSA
ncbi:MAG: N-acetylneuraminate synthase family protein [Planctomycetota bacterium]